MLGGVSSCTAYAFVCGVVQNKSSKDTRLLFATTGILLRRLTFSATIPDISHIIIDEVHERSVEIDFLLVILKRVLRVRKVASRVFSICY
jgi:HrpA-like RNA helicase